MDTMNRTAAWLSWIGLGVFGVLAVVVSAGEDHKNAQDGDGAVLQALSQDPLQVRADRIGEGHHHADDDDDDACPQTSDHARVSCQLEASADYWLARGKCENLPTDGQQLACEQQAAQDRESALEDCDAQFEARQEVCDELGEEPYHPDLEPEDFVAIIDNPYFPLTPGTTFIYQGQTAQGLEHVEVVVTQETREILGVTCVQVQDTVTLGGELIEDTLDWYAQDEDGNVWYFGENAKEYEDGLIVSLAGSWTAGVDGAKPGMIMKAQPQVDDFYRQEFSLGVAEDVAGVLSLTESVTVPFGSFDNCLQTEEFTPHSPGVFEQKFYAPGVGQVLTIDVDTGVLKELVEIR